MMMGPESVIYLVTIESRKYAIIQLQVLFKGGESSSQFRWFTTGKIFDIFCFDFEVAVA